MADLSMTQSAVCTMEWKHSLLIVYTIVFVVFKVTNDNIKYSLERKWIFSPNICRDLYKRSWYQSYQDLRFNRYIKSSIISSQFEHFDTLIKLPSYPPQVVITVLKNTHTQCQMWESTFPNFLFIEKSSPVIFTNIDPPFVRLKPTTDPS